MRHAVRNGALIREEEAVLPVTRREVFFNFSVYESLKVIGGTPLFVEDHIERFFDSAGILELSHPFSSKAIEESIEALVKADSVEEGTVKLLLVGGEEPLYLVYTSPLEKYSPEQYSGGIKVITYPGERVLPRAKSNCLLLNYMAGREAARKGALEALLVDRKGMVTEGTRSNLFGFTPGGELITAEEDVLFGVTRKHLLEIAYSKGIDVRFEKIGKRKIIAGAYSELCISSTSMGAMPIA
ncbi:MAG: aminotransferase class IV, partial [Spirochaetaceae bacterium]